MNRNSHDNDNTVGRPSNLYNGGPNTIKTAYLYRNIPKELPYELVIENYFGYDGLCITLIYVINHNVDTPYHGDMYWVKMCVCIYFGPSYSYLE